MDAEGEFAGGAFQGDRNDGQADEGDGLGVEPEVGADGDFRAVEQKGFLAEFGRGDGRREGQDHIDVFEDAHDFVVEPAAEALGLDDPGSGEHGAGDQAIPGVGVEAGGVGFEALAMEGSAFGGGHDEGGGAGAVSFGNRHTSGDVEA